MSENETRKSSFFRKFSRKANFFMGLGSGLIGLLIIGFFVLLFVVLGDSDSKSGKIAGDTRVAPTPTVQPTTGDHGGAPTAALAEVTESDHVRGDFDAPITIVEFSDFECPFCSRFHPTMTQLMDEYAGQVRWVYKHFPLSSIHPQAQGAAEASECAAEQGGNDAFWAFGDALFENQSRLGKPLYLELANNFGLNASEFESCLDEGRYRQKVQDQYQEGLAAGVRGTPGSFINGQSVPGAVPYEQIKAIVDGLL